MPVNARGKAFVMARLIQAKDMDALKAVWGTIGKEYQSDDQIKAMKDTLKEAFLANPNSEG